MSRALAVFESMFGNTHAFGQSRSRTRQDAADGRDRPAISAGIGVREWLEVLHPRPLSGARTADEAEAGLPGDALLPGANIVTTRAITIRADAADVWPWIAQLGQGRGGFYSYDRLENLLGCDIHSADRVHPEWQGIHTGDEVCLAPGMALTVALADPPRALVLRGAEIPMGWLGSPFDFTWAFTVRSEPGAGTRLVVRERYAYRCWWAGLLVRPTSLVSAVMSRRMLRRIRDRVEGRPREDVIRAARRLSIGRVLRTSRCSL